MHRSRSRVLSAAGVAVVAALLITGAGVAPAWAAGLSIGGRISLGTAGSPPAAGEVVVTWSDATGRSGTADAAADGTWSAAVPAAGTFTIAADYRGSGDWAGDTYGNRSYPDLLPVTVGASRSDLDIVLPHRHVLRGSVAFDSAGSHPAGAGARVVAQQTRDGSTWTDAGSAAVAADGSYSLALPPGQTVLRVDPTSAGYQSQYRGPADALTTAARFDLRAGDTTAEEIVLPRLGTISGTVRLQTSGSTAIIPPAGSVTVSWSKRCTEAECTTGPAPSTTTDADGVFRLTGLIDATYTLAIHYTGGTDYQDPTATYSAVVSRTKPDAVIHLVRIPQTFAASGTISLMDGAAVEAGRFRVDVWSDGSAPVATTTAAAGGAYSVSALPNGYYEISATDTQGRYSTTWYGGKPSYWLATRLGETPVTGADIAMPLPATIHGRFGDIAGLSATGLLVYLYYQDPTPQTSPPGTTLTTASVAADGTWSATGLFAGSYQIYAAPPVGYIPVPAGSTPGDPAPIVAVASGGSADAGRTDIVLGGAATVTARCGACIGSPAVTWHLSRRDPTTGAWTPLPGLDPATPTGLVQSWDRLVPGRYRAAATTTIGAASVTSTTTPFDVVADQRAAVDLALGGAARPPVGWLDSATAVPGGVRVRGWALDPDVRDALTADVAVDGRVVTSGTASGSRPDLDDLYHDSGTAHGFDLTATGLANGRHTVCVIVRDTATGLPVTIGCATVTVLAGTPFGWYDSLASSGPGQVTATGWALDPDTADPIDMHVYVDGRLAGITTADGEIPGLATAYPGYGTRHGARFVLNGLSGGAHSICLWAINVGSGAGNPLIGCRTVTVPSGNPTGWYDSLAGSGPGRATVTGWALDPDTTDPITMHVYVDGAMNQAVTASGAIPGLAAVWPGYGTGHGMSATVTGLSGGPHSICLWAINVGSGTGNPLIGCRTVTIPSGNPTGWYDSLAVTGPGRATVAGWALDPDTTDPITMHVYVDGAMNQAVTASGPIPGLAAVWPGYGTGHGMSATVTGLSGGAHSICLWAINVGSGTTNPLIGCRTVTIPTGNPVGWYDSLTSSAAGTATVKGWALDPDTAAPITMHVYVDGKMNQAVTADGPIPGLAAVWPGWGTGHGATATVTGLAPGAHSVCLWAINVGPGTVNPLIGCQSITVR